MEFTVRVSDLDQDPLNIHSETLPAGSTLTPGIAYGTAIFRWTPIAGDIGIHNVTFAVDDNGNNGAGPIGHDSATIAIRVRLTNSAPLLLPVGNQQATEGSLFQLHLQAVDADGDPLTYSATGLPPGSKLDGSTGILTWTPNLFQEGVYKGIAFTVSDGAASSSETVNLTVLHKNQAPLLAGIPPLGGQENALIQFNLVGTDPDGDALVYEAVNPLPAGSFFDTSNGLFEWIPGFSQAGDYTLRFNAKDPSGATDTLDVLLSIADVNRAPVIQFTNHLVLLGEQLSFTIGGTDPDPA
jgi:hypothetical protein